MRRDLRNLELERERERSSPVINKVEIRISCECVGGSILEAIPNKSTCLQNLVRTFKRRSQ